MASKLTVVNQVLSSVLLSYQAIMSVNKVDGQPAQETAQMIIDKVQPVLESNLFTTLNQINEARLSASNSGDGDE